MLNIIFSQFSAEREENLQNKIQKLIKFYVIAQVSQLHIHYTVILQLVLILLSPLFFPELANDLLYE
jgi:hypothetical protein